MLKMRRKSEHLWLAEGRGAELLCRPQSLTRPAGIEQACEQVERGIAEFASLPGSNLERTDPQEHRTLFVSANPFELPLKRFFEDWARFRLKHEIRNPKQIPSTNVKNDRTIGFLRFGFLICFVLRISDFRCCEIR